MRAWLLLAVAVAACYGPYQAPVHPPSSAPLVAGLVHEPCLEGCPVYAVAIYGDGLVEYDGVENVDVVGRRITFIDPARIATLRDDFARYGWAQLGDQNGVDDCTDQPSQRLTFEGRTIVIDEGHPGLPSEARLLVSLVDQAAGTDRWTGGRIRMGFCP